MVVTRTDDEATGDKSQVSISSRLLAEALAFGQGTSSHGIGRISQTGETKWYRAIWCLLTLTGVGFAIYNVATNLNEYYSYPYQFIETLQLSSAIPFPAITVCPAFPFPTVGQKSREIRQLLDNVKKDRCYTESSRTKLSTLLATSAEVFLFGVLDGQTDTVGFEADTFVASCRYGLDNCYPSNFTSFIDASLFNCFTLNLNEIASEGKTLKMWLYLATDTESYNFSDVIDFRKAGAYIQVHEHNVLPQPSVYGDSLKPGTYNKILLEATHKTLLSNPYSTNCSDQELFNSEYKYDINTCQKICLQEQISAECGCLYAGGHIKKPPNYKGSYCLNDLCNFTTVEHEAKCLKTYIANHNSFDACPDCLTPPCSQWMYTRNHQSFDHLANVPMEDIQEVVMATQPPSVALQAFIDAVELYDDFSHASSSQFSAQNFIYVEVGFADVILRQVNAEPLIGSAFTLFSDIGGGLGFWLGFSVLTLFEVGEFIVRLVISGCRTRWSSNMKTGPSNK